MLIELASQQPIYIIIDALDECPPKDRKRLIRLLKPKVGEGVDWCPISILITSRLLDEFQELSTDFHRINITANARDIRMFVDYHFKTQTHLRRFAMQDRDFADDVKAQVIQRCNGIARQVLRELPSGLDGTYKLALDRIGQQSKKKQKLAWDTLAWITHSKRQLRVVELQHALACVPGTQDFDPERIIHEDDIRDVCGGLVVFSQGFVSLVHYTTSTYFELRKADLFPAFHATIAKTCVSYLGLKVLEQPDDEDKGMSYADDLYDDPADAKTLDLHRHFNIAPPQRPKILTYRTKCQEFPFFLYSIHSLGHHLRAISSEECPEDLCDAVCSLLRSRPKRNFLCRKGVLDRSSLESEDNQEPADNDSDSDTDDDENSARDSSSADTVTTLTDASSLPKPEITPLHLAAYLGWGPLIEVLANADLDINALDIYGQTPIAIATQEGHFDALEALLKRGATVNLNRNQGHAIILHAAQNNQQRIVHDMIVQALLPFKDP
ncbi:ankyrin, partial [Amniculicola lignicola CBS 123094]